MRDGVGAVLAKGTDFLLYTIADRIVDGYFPMMDKLADEIDDLQDQVVESPNEWTLQKVFTMKKELLSIRRATSPAREVFNQLTNRELTVIAPDHLVYFRDVYDHLIRVTDELDNYRDLARRHARHLPLDGQQQPVEDHEAADRRDRDPRRHRGGGRHLRDERGRHGAREAASRAGSG